jgi:hypothetical protein
MSECKNSTCEDEASFAYADDFCSSTCQIMHLEKQNADLRSNWEAMRSWVNHFSDWDEHKIYVKEAARKMKDIEGGKS